MAFIDKTDLVQYIKQNKLDDITDFDDNKLDTAIEEMIEVMKGYLNARYDVAVIFAQTGTNRDAAVKMYLCDLVIYRVHRLINWRKIPEQRRDAKIEAMEWLEGVMAGEINPPTLPVPIDGSKDYITFGGNTPNNYNYN